MDYNYENNNNQYSTTTYGAQGGAGGGGFLNQGSQGSPGSGSKQYGKDTLRPVTIKQLLDAQLPHPDAESFKVDGSDISQITFVGQIRNISQQTTNITYKLDDGTGTIEVKMWIDTEAANAMETDETKQKLQLSAYARVWGRLKLFGSKRHVGAHVIRPLSDYNEIQYHLLEATTVHLFFTRGPPEALDKAAAQGGHGDQQGAFAGAKALPSNLSSLARRVYKVLETTPQSNEGLHMHDIASRLGVETVDVQHAGDELLNSGIIYTTEDDHTWAILDV